MSAGAHGAAVHGIRIRAGTDARRRRWILRCCLSQRGDGITTGTITTAGGTTTSFAIRSLALASPADLAPHGLPEEYRRLVANNQVPGEYVAVIASGGSHWFGGSGDVRAGLPGVNIIGLDKQVAPRPLPISPIR